MKLLRPISSLVVLFIACSAEAWTGEIHGRIFCDVCGDSSIGSEDHPLEGAEVAVLCITKSGGVLNYQAFTNRKGTYRVVETMPESDRWESCLARPMSTHSHWHCSRRGDPFTGIKFTYDRPSGHSRFVKPFLFRPAASPAYCLQ